MSKIENSSSPDMEAPTVDFGFGFNDAVFSDRLLHIEVTKADSSDSNGDLNTDNVAEVKTLHINSLVLAASSNYFYKLFKNGTAESQEKDITLRINASEDSALMDVLKFIYSNTLGATATQDLLTVLIAADKFEVTSCMRHCSRLLQKVPMSLESALLYLELPSTVLLCEGVRPLVAATKEYLAAQYPDFNKFRNELMDLPLCAIEAILGTDGLQVNSEDDVVDFVLEWASVHYPIPKERQQILAERLVQCICFRNMSYSKLKEVLVCPDFNHEEVSKLVLEALFLKVEVPEISTAVKCASLVRTYKNRPIKVVQLEFAQPRCVVYFDIRRDECENIFQSLPRSYLYSESFCLGGRWFSLLAHCFTEKQPNSFQLYLRMPKESESFTLDYEFAVIKKSWTCCKLFQKIKEGNINNSKLLTSGTRCHNLFGISWTAFMKTDSEYFIDGVLHLRVDLTMNNSEA